MKLEQQVTSLELSKKLKELGVKQDSLYRWWQEEKNFGKFSIECGSTIGISDSRRGECIPMYSAFTVAELGEMLPEKIRRKVEYSGETENYFLEIYPSEDIWEVRYQYYYYEPSDSFKEKDKSEANARAKMLIYLLENNLLPTPKEDNK